MYKLMIVEDDLGIAEEIQKKAQMWSMDTCIAQNFQNVLEEFTLQRPHLVLLDISLPFFSGYHWCNEIRKISKVPIIFISSAADNMNIVMAMNAGADDFIPKPFDLNVLIAKIQALLRRSYDFAMGAPAIGHRGAFLNTEDQTLIYESQKLELSKNEFRILLCLMESKGKVVSREKLMERLWTTELFVDENTLTVNINRLRKKLDAMGLSNFITTKFGVGYIVE